MILCSGFFLKFLATDDFIKKSPNKSPVQKDTPEFVRVPLGTRNRNGTMAA